MKVSQSILSLSLVLFGLGTVAAPQGVSIALAIPSGTPTPSLEFVEATKEEPETKEDGISSNSSSLGSPPPVLEIAFSKLKNIYRRYIADELVDRGWSKKCNFGKVMVRKEWGTMSQSQRKKYTDAVKCLYNRPSQSDPVLVPGARNRLDDFVATHLTFSNNIHFNGYVFAWHRHFTYLYDQELRNECGYSGPTPYWDWVIDNADPRRSTVFDGSEFSMGGNGETIPHGNTSINAFGITLSLPPGTGGGCVTEGPFTDLVINLGLSPNVSAPDQNQTAPPDVTSHYLAPFADAFKGDTTAAVQKRQNDVPPEILQGLNYNPRCMTRDINLQWAALATTTALARILSCGNVRCLEQRIDGWEEGASDEQQARDQLHGGGHFTIGGLNNDPFASPGDPVFFLHHANLDRLWTIWQSQNPTARLYEVGGTRTPFNNPPSDNVRETDVLRYGVVGKDIIMRDVGSTLDGPYCYVYA
ncbi:Di-copper centre-containing protein [Eremomyces bilateralis CBS 781.70]|uniref:Di-copper centre-containing protein n=1 Tax=Eremomyces bilateralis CBS 781.70 TaxID=1392243 RepID=A0A6G1G481_9PEZI|nr:Di-copper centre-containing protein [Eremomyces bilateralis CBS 781.70]KAF1812874.1 Di-copper centre-containing protein [Eremomyces bilateralis CBS 781.70]